MVAMSFETSEKNRPLLPRCPIMHPLISKYQTKVCTDKRPIGYLTLLKISVTDLILFICVNTVLILKYFCILNYFCILKCCFLFF